SPSSPSAGDANTERSVSNDTHAARATRIRRGRVFVVRMVPMVRRRAPANHGFTEHTRHAARQGESHRVERAGGSRTVRFALPPGSARAPPRPMVYQGSGPAPCEHARKAATAGASRGLAVAQVGDRDCASAD